MLSSLGFGSRGRAAAKQTSRGLATFFSSSTTANPTPTAAAAKLELSYSRHGDSVQSYDRTAGPIDTKQIKAPSGQALPHPSNVDEYVYQRPLAPKLDISESYDSLRCETGSIFDITANINIPVDVTDTLSDATSTTSSPPSPSPLMRPRASSVTVPAPKPIVMSAPLAPPPTRPPPAVLHPPQTSGAVHHRAPIYFSSHSDPRYPASREVSPDRGRDPSRPTRMSPPASSSFVFPTTGDADEVHVARPGSSSGPRPRRMSRDQPIPGPQRRASADRPALRLETDRMSPQRQGSHADAQYQHPHPHPHPPQQGATHPGPSGVRPRLDSIDYAARHYRHDPPGLGPSVTLSFPAEVVGSASVAVPANSMPISRRTDQDVLPSRPRRNSDMGAGRVATGTSPPQDSTSSRQTSSNSIQTIRSVRWDENLICPSPILPSQRRQGWFNRRGDQLWTNDGKFRSPPVEEQYPPDLDGYPEAGQGWMNEQGVRIDMQHRLVPKVPARSALKRATI